MKGRPASWKCVVRFGVTNPWPIKYLGKLRYNSTVLFERGGRCYVDARWEYVVKYQSIKAAAYRRLKGLLHNYLKVPPLQNDNVSTIMPPTIIALIPLNGGHLNTGDGRETICSRC